MTDEASGEGAEMAKVLLDLAQVGEAALTGVLAVCARLAMKGTFGAADVRKVIQVMREAPTPECELAARIIDRTIGDRLPELEKIVGESISEPRPGTS